VRRPRRSSSPLEGRRSHHRHRQGNSDNASCLSRTGARCPGPSGLYPAQLLIIWSLKNIGFDDRETLRQRVPTGRVEAHRMTMNGTEARKFDGAAGRPSLVDPFGRDISYLRVSVTDRCDFRCVYCMSENMAFLPKADVLTLEELDRLCSAFVARGVRKLRLTGGEPLVRRGIMTLVNSLSRHLHTGDLDELTLTTNGSQLAKYAQEIKAAGVRRINVSLDTLDAEKFRAITRWGSLDQVLAGIDAALAAGLKIKINAVALKGVNDDEFPQLIEWAHGRGMDLTLIEVMPLGEIGEGRLEQYLPLSIARARLSERFSLEDIDYRTGGPARYVRVAETGGLLGFITPMTHNFCESCNRVRVTCTGTLYMCLGQEDAADLRKPLRASESDDLLFAAMDEAISRKPKGHDFVIDRRHRRPALARHMSVTGG
jgi:cyclic pyranopterin phosphate synthase